MPEGCRCEFAAPPSHHRRQRTVDGSTNYMFQPLAFTPSVHAPRWRPRAMLIGAEVSKTSSSPQISEYRHNTLIPAISRCPRCKDSLAGYSPSKFSPPSCTWPIGLASHLRLDHYPLVLYHPNLSDQDSGPPITVTSAKPTQGRPAGLTPRIPTAKTLTPACFGPRRRAGG